MTSRAAATGLLRGGGVLGAEDVDDEHEGLAGELVVV